MALEIHHNTNGCEAIIRQKGNELSDWVVHIFHCPFPSTTAVEMPNGTILKCCDEHKEQWLERLNNAKEI